MPELPEVGRGVCYEFHPPPLRVTQEIEGLVVGAHRTAGTVDMLLFDFGAVSSASSS